MKIAIHAGHNPDGKVGCGAVGIVKESVVNRVIVGYLAEALRSYGVDVVDVTVDNGTSAANVLQELKARTNAVNPDLSVSIHLNAFDGVANGTEAYCYLTNTDMKDLCTRITQKISSLGVRNRGAIPNGNLYVLRHITAPSILVETYFCDNASDCATMKNKESEIAQAIADAIAEKYALTANTPQEAKGHFYRVQVGAFTQKENAQKLLEELTKAGFPGYVKEGE